MLRAAFLVVVLAVANAASFPTNYLADLVISKMEAVTNSTPTSISGFKIISPKPMSWDEADVSAGGFTSVGKIVRTGESKTSMASGKFLLVIPFRMETVEASFRVTIIQYFSPWFKYSQSVTADHVGEGNLKIQVTTVGGKCKGTFHDLDFNFDDKMTTVAGTPVPNEVSAAKDISDFVTTELAKRYLSLIPSWSKPYVAAVASKALKDINFC
ncbi:hypothetical protein GE061_016635 [Apolygus lucorum]|uniref:Lipid-binding serum glycoprotein N-terminal domain-containing protein n=1 Tax=Apolygus lucorum TaxID=248454 RepID=A0A6A4JVY3_APOLU|nr:hypothetical protein GE061_016635 [Apolygus lucorum]